MDTNATMFAAMAKQFAIASGNTSLVEAFKHTSPDGTPEGPYMHGPGGLFSIPGVEREVISTRLLPKTLASVLPARGSVYMSPLFAYVSGFGADSGDEKDGVCDDAMTAGPIENCFQTAQFGRYERRTRELEVNRIGQVNDRSELFDLRLINPPLTQNQGGLTPDWLSDFSGMLASEIKTRFTEVGVSLQNLLARQVYEGNPANNAGGGGYKEFPGLDILIGSNKVDAQTGTRCAGLDSLIRDFNYASVTDIGPDIVNTLTYQMRALTHIASRGNFNPVTWSLVMRQELFYELTAVWPCSYLTYRCIQRNDNDRNSIDPNDAIGMRDAMRQGSYLVLDGNRYEVVIDDALNEETSTTSASVPNSGSFASDIYIIPRTVRGGIAATYWEYFDYQRGTMQAIREGRYENEFWSDGGRYLWVKQPQKNWCIQHQVKIEPRLVLKTPQLAGRLNNILYSPLIHTQDTFSDQPYFVPLGGETSRQAPSYYSDWNLPA